MNKEKDDEKRAPILQWLYDDVFLMFLLGITVPAIFYTIWGLASLASVGTAK